MNYDRESSSLIDELLRSRHNHGFHAWYKYHDVTGIINCGNTKYQDRGNMNDINS